MQRPNNATRQNRYGHAQVTQMQARGYAPVQSYSNNRVSQLSSIRDVALALPRSENGYEAGHHADSQPHGTQPNGYGQYGYSPNPGDVHRQQRPTAPQQWQSVPRSWQDINPAVDRIVSDPALSQDISAPPSNARNAYPHTLTQGYTQSRSYEQRQYASNKDRVIRGQQPGLSVADLERLNNANTPIASVDRWSGANQRDGPWDGVGRVTQEERGHQRTDGC